MNVLIWLALISIRVVDPVYPPDAVMGGTVVAELHFEAGNVKSLRMLSGEDPFGGPTRSALSEWKLEPKQDSDELVVVHFRQPYLYHVSKSREEISPVKPGPSLPYPRVVIAPPYPANTLGQGSVVLLVEISANGRVTDAKIVQGMGALTEASLEAVRKWEFTPPADANGVKQISHAYVVFVYRLPISVQQESK